jgi:drug/metabolite transporter (DMT)-like permease
VNASTPAGAERSRPAVGDLLLLAVLSVVWGASYTFIRVGVATIPPLTLVAARTVLASLLLLVVLWQRGVSLPGEPLLWRRFLVQALLNSVVPWVVIAWAERSVSAGLATILNSTSPIQASLITVLVVRHEPVSRRRLFGVLLGLAGTVLVVGADALTSATLNILPELALVAAATCYAGAAVYGRTFRQLDPAVPATGSMLCGAVLLVPLSLTVDQPWRSVPSRSSIVALLALASLSTTLAFVIYFRLVRTLGSVATTAQAYLRVPVGVAIGALTLGEHVTLLGWIGLCCVVVGVAAMTASRPGLSPCRKPTADR